MSASIKILSDFRNAAGIPMPATGRMIEAMKRIAQLQGAKP